MCVPPGRRRSGADSDAVTVPWSAGVAVAVRTAPRSGRRWDVPVVTEGAERPQSRGGRRALQAACLQVRRQGGEQAAPPESYPQSAWSASPAPVVPCRAFRWVPQPDGGPPPEARGTRTSSPGHQPASQHPGSSVPSWRPLWDLRVPGHAWLQQGFRTQRRLPSSSRRAPPCDGHPSLRATMSWVAPAWPPSCSERAPWRRAQRRRGRVLPCPPPRRPADPASCRSRSRPRHAGGPPTRHLRCSDWS